METSILNEFIILEETNSFSKAAKELQMSQATLSRHIMQLEKEYGVLLFERTTQKMKLTPYGESLVAYAQSILDSEQSFKRDIERISFKKSNHLKIGTVDFPFYYGITSHLAEFKKQHPDASLDVHIESSDLLVEMLKKGHLDLAFLRDIDNCASAFDGFLYCEDYMRIAIPADHPLAGFDSATLAQFSQDTFFKRYKKNSLMDKLFNSMLEKSGFTPHISASEATWEDSAINDLAAVTTCLGGLAENFKGNIHVKVLTLEPKTYANIFLAAPKNNTKSDLAQDFLDYVHSTL